MIETAVLVAIISAVVGVISVIANGYVTDRIWKKNAAQKQAEIQLEWISDLRKAGTEYASSLSSWLQTKLRATVDPSLTSDQVVAVQDRSVTAAHSLFILNHSHDREKLIVFHNEAMRLMKADTKEASLHINSFHYVIAEIIEGELKNIETLLSGKSA